MIEIAADGREWSDFVRGHPDAIPFHHPAWLLLLAECYQFRPSALVLPSSAGGIAAGLPVIEVASRFRPRRWVSLPFTDICPPLGAGTEAIFAELERVRLERGLGEIEVRSNLPGGSACSAPAAVTHTLRLDQDPDPVVRGFRASTRRNARAAERHGVVIRLGESERDLVETFYRLHVLTRRRFGLPVQPRRFFRLLWRRMVEPGLAFVLLAHHGSVPVAGAVFLCWNRTVTYKYGASDPLFWGLRPNDLLFSQAIRRACEEGYERFDFGRTELGNDSLRRFKLGWGSTESELAYTIVGGPERAVRNPPVVVRGLIRRAPTWVSRGLGELFYRRTA